MDHRPFNYQQYLRKNSFYPNFLPLLDSIVIAGLIAFLSSNFLFFHGEKVFLPTINLDSQYSHATEVLSVTPDGQFFFRNRKMSYDEFYVFFQNSHKENALDDNSVLLVKIGSEESMQTFINIKKLAESVGYKEILIASERSNSL